MLNKTSTAKRVINPSLPMPPKEDGIGDLLFRRRLSGFVKDLDAPLLKLGPDSVATLRDCCTGIHVFGGIGQGKTSGSGRMYAGAFLRAGMGGCVTCAKPDDLPLWQGYAAEHGRSRSLVVFDEREGFNFLDYLLALHGMEGIGTITEALMRILEAAKQASGANSGGGGEDFWQDAMRSVLRYAIPPIYAANGSLSIGDILRYISSAPPNAKELRNAEWQRRSFMYQTMCAATNAPKIPMSSTMIKNVSAFWSQEFPAIPEKTRGNIVITISAALDRFRHGRLAKAFCGRTTLFPEMSFHGSILLLGMPTLTWNEDGVIAQMLFKYLWQRAVLARNRLAEKHRERPVFLFSDESQETVSSFDFEYQSLCRSSKACTVYMTQSLPTYYAKMGGKTPKEASLALVGKFGIHVYHANACAETNEFASRTLGRVLTRRENGNSGTSRNMNYGMSAGSNISSGNSSSSGMSFSSSGNGQGSSGVNSSSGSTSGSGVNWGSNRGRGESENQSRGWSESVEYAMEAGDFARVLKTGGPANGNEVTGVLFQSGRIFKETGTNSLLVRFKQS